MDKQYNNVIFFDGICGLCNGFVDFVMSVDKKQKFLFSPLQSDFAREHLPEEMTKDLKSIVLLQNGKLLTKSQAVIKVLNDVGGIWKMANAGKFLPGKMRNMAYDMVAENRYKLFGKKETCRLPSPEERTRFVS